MNYKVGQLVKYYFFLWEYKRDTFIAPITAIHDNYCLINGDDIPKEDIIEVLLEPNETRRILRECHIDCKMKNERNPDVHFQIKNTFWNKNLTPCIDITIKDKIT